MSLSSRLDSASLQFWRGLLWLCRFFEDAFDSLCSIFASDKKTSSSETPFVRPAESDEIAQKDSGSTRTALPSSKRKTDNASGIDTPQPELLKAENKNTPKDQESKEAPEEEADDSPIYWAMWECWQQLRPYFFPTASSEELNIDRGEFNQLTAKKLRHLFFTWVKKNHSDKTRKTGEDADKEFKVVEPLYKQVFAFKGGREEDITADIEALSEVAENRLLDQQAFWIDKRTELNKKEIKWAHQEYEEAKQHRRQAAVLQQDAEVNDKKLELLLEEMNRRKKQMMEHQQTNIQKSAVHQAASKETELPILHTPHTPWTEPTKPISPQHSHHKACVSTFPSSLPTSQYLSSEKQNRTEKSGTGSSQAFEETVMFHTYKPPGSSNGSKAPTASTALPTVEDEMPGVARSTTRAQGSVTPTPKKLKQKLPSPLT